MLRAELRTGLPSGEKSGQADARRECTNRNLAMTLVDVAKYPRTFALVIEVDGAESLPSPFREPAKQHQNIIFGDVVSPVTAGDDTREFYFSHIPPHYPL